MTEFGPSWFPLYAIFAYRTRQGGGTLGRNIYLTPSRKGPLKLLTWLALFATGKILNSGGAQDAVIQNKIDFRIGPETFSDPAFAAFVEYTEQQPFVEICEVRL